MAWRNQRSTSQANWSATRDQFLQTCERKYYFHYLAGGRINSDDPLQQRIGKLKKLKTVSMWQGECVHWIIAQYLSACREGRTVAHARLKEILREKIERDWLYSAARKYRREPWLIDKAGVALLEHEYEEMPADMNAAVVYEACARMLDRFMVWAEAVAGLPAILQAADRVWIEPQSFGADAPGFMLDDVQVLTKVDLACERVGVSFDIYDWKTGSAPRSKAPYLSSNELQVAIYQLWPTLGLGLTNERVSSRLVYLGGEVADEWIVQSDGEDTATVLFGIKSSIRLARRWEGYVASGAWRLEELSYAGSPQACAGCQYKRLCREALQGRKPHE